MARVIHTSQALVDIVVHVAHLPVRGGNVNADSVHTYAGGAVNILIGAARAGASAVHAGTIGTGPQGDLIHDVLSSAGIAMSAPRNLESDTGVCYVFIEPSGERSFVTTRGAERSISYSSLASSNPGAGDYVCVSGYGLLEATRKPLMDFVTSLDDEVVVVLDPGEAFAGLDSQLQSAMLDHTDIWTSNLDEAHDLIRHFLPSSFDEIQATVDQDQVSRLTQVGANVAKIIPDAVVVVRDGARGCVVVSDAEPIWVPGFPQVPVDTNGAGDTHTGVMIGELCLGTDLVDAAVRANAAGAIKVTRHGPASCPSRDEIDQFLIVNTERPRQ